MVTEGVTDEKMGDGCGLGGRRKILRGEKKVEEIEVSMEGGGKE